MNNIERYVNLKRKKPDFFPRPNKVDDEAKFRRPTAVRKEDSEWQKTRQELLLTIDKKKVVVRENHRPLRREMLQELGFINPKKRHLRSKSPVRSRSRNRK